MTSEQRAQLIRMALDARHRAYAPYSQFRVGAALLTAEGMMISGCNVENASYGLTNCAERTAIFTAVAAGHANFVAIAVATEGGHSPCGACRQVLLVDASHPDTIVETTLDELLPRRFPRPAT